ncbi:MAG: phage capsid protein, partial [Candidatus Poseidoniales archaeon]
MANSIDTAFIKQFETEVHMAYQRMGSKLRNTVRTSNVTGSTARFQVIGKGTASTKSRNGNVTPMELAHTTVEATMADHYAAEYIDKLDELKININERQAVAQSAAAALGRKTDEIITTAMDAGANATQIADATGALVKAD